MKVPKLAPGERFKKETEWAIMKTVERMHHAMEGRPMHIVGAALKHILEEFKAKAEQAQKAQQEALNAKQSAEVTK